MKYLGHAVSVLLACLVASCVRGPYDWGDHNVLTDRAPRPERKLGPTTLRSNEDYFQVLDWAETWFRSLTFGNERTMTDIAGLMNAPIVVPCESSCASGCYRRDRVFGYFLRAIDDLDGVRGNLFSGNGGPNGTGFTSDLVVRFPKGTTVHGIPVPEALHTGFDVEAGSPLPLGVVAIPAKAEEQALPYLFDLNAAGVGKAPPERVRIGLTCATCHYSLDVDWDGKADLRSAKLGVMTPQSPYHPEDAWALGNQDIHLGWLFALSDNPLLGFTIESGPVGPNNNFDARQWAKWVKANYRRAPDAVRHEVALGMVSQPRGYADDTPDAVHNPTQFPTLFTYRNWPYNVDGVLVNDGDRNNNVWAAALEFSAIVSLGSDRAGGAQKIVADERTVFSDFTAAELADVFLYNSPAVRTAGDPQRMRAVLEAMTADVLGASDGVPGLVDPDSAIVMKGVPGVMPKEILNHPANAKRRRLPEAYGEDAIVRGPMVGMLGVRVRTPPSVRDDPGFRAFLARYPEISRSAVRIDEFVSDAISLMLDWVEPPTNHSPLLANADALVQRGYQIFKDEPEETSDQCVDCHRGPFFTDNLVNSYKKIGTNKMRAVATAPLESFAAPAYDPATGRAITSGFFGFFFGGKQIGYKTLTLRYLWGSAPYLHDGGVAVGLSPGGAPEGNDLAALLGRPDKVYGMGNILRLRESDAQPTYRANAALSLQALLLKSERDKVLAGNRKAVFPVPGKPEPVSAVQLGIEGIGHEYFIRDRPGGPKITALIAFLLALDDCPGKHTSLSAQCGR